MGLGDILNETGNETNLTKVKQEFFKEFDNAEINSSDTEMMITSSMPKSMTDSTVSEFDLKVLMNDVLARDSGWECRDKGEKVPGGWILRGRWKTNVTFTKIDERIKNSNVSSLSICYVVDPKPLTEDEIELGQVPDGVLYVTQRPEIKASWLGSIVTLSTFFSLFAYSLGGFALNEAVMARLELAQKNGGDVSWLLDLAQPIFLAILAQQFAREVSKFVVAKSEDIKLSPPCLVPSFNFGTIGSVVRMKTPAPNRNALFDLGVVGPSSGLGLSVVMLVLGLVATKTSGVDVSMFPRLPIAFLQSSALAGGVIDAILGDVVSGPDPSATIALHPLAVAGFAGIVTSALNFLPIGSTDGGRVSLAVFGRSGHSVVNGLCLLCLLLAGLGGSDVLLFYGAITAISQRELELPCKDEVSEIDAGRVVYIIVMGLLSLMALLPLPITTPY